jgi:hypothetical protein
VGPSVGVGVLGRGQSLVFVGMKWLFAEVTERCVSVNCSWLSGLSAK